MAYVLGKVNIIYLLAFLYIFKMGVCVCVGKHMYVSVYVNIQAPKPLLVVRILMVLETTCDVFVILSFF